MKTHFVARHVTRQCLTNCMVYHFITDTTLSHRDRQTDRQTDRQRVSANPTYQGSVVRRLRPHWRRSHVSRCQINSVYFIPFSFCKITTIILPYITVTEAQVLKAASILKILDNKTPKKSSQFLLPLISVHKYIIP